MKKKFYYIQDNQLKAVHKNEYFNGVAISNFDLMLNGNIEFANANGYYELDSEEVDYPEYDEATQHIEASYSLVGNVIKVAYNVINNEG
jgi:hypothetical protein